MTSPYAKTPGVFGGPAVLVIDAEGRCGRCRNCLQRLWDQRMAADIIQGGGGAEILGAERPCLRVQEVARRQAEVE